MNKNMLNKHKVNESLSSIILMVFAFFVGLYFLGLGNTGLFDVDEAIFAEASYEMLETGDYVTPHYNGEPRYHKPPLIYWLQSFSMEHLGKSSFAARLPSAILGFLTILSFYLFISGMTKNRRLAITASVILGGNLSFLVISQAATADMALNFFMVTSTMALLANLFATRRSPLAPLMIGVGLGLAMLAKGPVSLMVPFFVIGAAVFFRPNIIYNLKCANPIYLVTAMIVTLIPWIQFVVDAKGLDFFREFILVHNLGRFTNAMGNTQSSSHFYYVVVLFFGFFPWVLLLPSAIKHAMKNFIGNLRSDKAEEALPSLGLIWFLSIFVFFSFSATKLPHYILPAYAGAALMIAARLEDLWDKPLSKWYLLWIVPITLIFSSVFVLFKYIPDIMLGRFDKLPTLLQKLLNALQVKIEGVEDQTIWMMSQNIPMNSSSFALGILTLVGVSVSLYFIYKKQRAGVILLSSVTGIMLLIMTFTVVPTVYKFTQKPLANIGEKIKENFDKENDKLYFIAIHQPSVRFVSGVPFKALPNSNAVLNQDMDDSEAMFWFVLKQERLDNLKKHIPTRLSETSCEGGYCLVKTRVANIGRF